MMPQFQEQSTTEFFKADLSLQERAQQHLEKLIREHTGRDDVHFDVEHFVSSDCVRFANNTPCIKVRFPPGADLPAKTTYLDLASGIRELYAPDGAEARYRAWDREQRQQFAANRKEEERIAREAQEHKEREDIDRGIDSMWHQNMMLRVFLRASDSIPEMSRLANLLVEELVNHPSRKTEPMPNQYRTVLGYPEKKEF
jgi:hypothetical protein